MYRMEKFTNGAAVGAGTTTTLFGALSLNDWALVVGIVCTVGTFAINL
ncbi:holin [Buttiauxella sp. 3AFRM03]|nr:HP1 family phage holin [Buttiauxella sp. 3AFRM03]AYN29883.1 holin [Buttiauxella sp. 3AFRM03]